MAEQYYQSAFSGAQIDEGIGRIISGELDQLVNDAISAANIAQKAAEEAEKLAATVKGNAETATAAANAAEVARAAAVAAAVAAEAAAELARQSAELAAEDAATKAAQGVENKLAGYVSEAEQAKTDAQNAAGTAATDAVNSVNTQLAQHVSDAQAAQKAAEKARDDAQAIAGGNFLPLSGGTMTGELIGTEATFKDAFHNGTVDYNVAKFSTTTTVDEIVIKTTIPVWSTGMPLVHLKGYAFGDQSPVEMNIAFYCPGNGTFSSAGCTSTSPWKPTVKLSKWKYGLGQYDEYVAISLVGSIYYPRFVVDVTDIWDNRTRHYKNWTIEHRVAGSGASIVPQDLLTTVPYKAIGNDIIGNSSTATKLETARKINGVPFDGTSDITIVPAEPVPIPLGGTGAASAEDARINLGVPSNADLTATYDEILSRGEQLVVNGSGMLGNNTGFSKFTFDGNVTNKSQGSFKYNRAAYEIYTGDQFVPINISKNILCELDIKSQNGLTTWASFLDFYDVDKKKVTATNYNNVSTSLTTLTQDLKNGDTVVHFADLSGWNANAPDAIDGFIFWGYTNSYGKVYPARTYSQNVWSSLFNAAGVDVANNTITLKSPWSYGTFKAGTEVSQCIRNGGYNYFLSTKTIPTDWLHAKGIYGSGHIGAWPDAAYVKIGFLCNSNRASDTVWFTNVSIKEYVDVPTTAEMNAAISAAIGTALEASY